MPEIYAVHASASIGPVYVAGGKPRDQYSHEMTETCSLTDRVYQDKSSQMKITELDAATGIRIPVPDYLHANLKVVVKKEGPEVVVEDYEEMITEHVERRVLFFFQQLIAVYKTKLYFESVGASDQAVSATAVAVKVNGSTQELTKRQAAHSSTHPRLIAYDSQAWKKYKEQGGPKPEGFVFLKGTDYYRTQNATMNMPKAINDADREIDEKTAFSKLREKSAVVVNKTSRGDLTPDQGIIEFCTEALGEVRAAKARLAAANKDPAVQKVLSQYEDNLVEIMQQVKNDPLFLGNFLNIKFADHLDAKSTGVLLKIRYAAIRNLNIKQAELIQKVEIVRKRVLNAVTHGRKPDYFDLAFRAIVIQQAKTKEDRQRLEKLFNFSLDHFAAQNNATAVAKYTKTKGLLAPHLKDINFIARDILQDMRKLRTEEANQRAQITKDLRAMKGWIQRELGEEVKKQFPNAAASQSTICRIERCMKLVSPQIAGELSQVFGVDSGLFMPHFFYD